MRLQQQIEELQKQVLNQQRLLLAASAANAAPQSTAARNQHGVAVTLKQISDVRATLREAAGAAGKAVKRSRHSRSSSSSTSSSASACEREHDHPSAPASRQENHAS
eukprot:4179243-Pleurochrysis_carterae.AAC.1